VGNFVICKKGEDMKRIIILFVITFLCGACATPYKQASKPSSKGYYDTLLQEGVYDISFNGNDETSLKRVKDYALLRAAEVCLENGFVTFSIINSENNSRTESAVITNTTNYNTGYSYSYSYVGTETSPSVSIVIQCSKDDNLFFKAKDLNNNLRAKYKIK